MDRKDYAYLRSRTTEQLAEELDEAKHAVAYIEALQRDRSLPYGPEPTRDVIVTFYVNLGQINAYRFAAVAHVMHGRRIWNVTGNRTPEAPVNCTWAELTQWIADNRGTDLVLFSTTYQSEPLSRGGEGTTRVERRTRQVAR
jgi:hypothetical protein